jgi:hypothetical protein
MHVIIKLYLSLSPTPAVLNQSGQTDTECTSDTPGQHNIEVRPLTRLKRPQAHQSHRKNLGPAGLPHDRHNGLRMVCAVPSSFLDSFSKDLFSKAKPASCGPPSMTNDPAGMPAYCVVYAVAWQCATPDNCNTVYLCKMQAQQSSNTWNKGWCISPDSSHQHARRGLRGDMQGHQSKKMLEAG